MRSSRGNSQAGSRGSSYSEIPVSVVLFSEESQDLADWVLSITW